MISGTPNLTAALRRTVFTSNLTAAQQTSILNLLAFFFEISNRRKITGENIFNGDHFEIEGNHGSSKDEKTLF